MTTSRFVRLISSEDASEVQRWRVPDMDRAHEEEEGVESPSLETAEVASEPEEPAPQLPTAEEIEAIQRDAREEGWQCGYREGLAAAEAEVRQRIESLDVLLGSLQAPLQRADDQVVEQLTRLATLLAKQIIRRELHLDSGQIVAVVREALTLMPASGPVTVLLHPEDASLLREALGEQGEERNWHIEEDTLISRGGCQVKSETSRIDATLERQISAMVASVLGGEREDDQ